MILIILTKNINVIAFGEENNVVLLNPNIIANIYSLADSVLQSHSPKSNSEESLPPTKFVPPPSQTFNWRPFSSLKSNI